MSGIWQSMKTASYAWRPAMATASRPLHTTSASNPMWRNIPSATNWLISLSSTRRTRPRVGSGVHAGGDHAPRAKLVDENEPVGRVVVEQDSAHSVQAPGIGDTARARRTGQALDHSEGQDALEAAAGAEFAPHVE